jgi:hypothetical protein
MSCHFRRKTGRWYLIVTDGHQRHQIAIANFKEGMKIAAQLRTAA